MLRSSKQVGSSNESTGISSSLFGRDQQSSSNSGSKANGMEAKPMEAKPMEAVVTAIVNFGVKKLQMMPFTMFTSRKLLTPALSL